MLKRILILISEGTDKKRYVNVNRKRVSIVKRKIDIKKYY